jgi:hypothetical protein
LGVSLRFHGRASFPLSCSARLSDLFGSLARPCW